MDHLPKGSSTHVHPEIPYLIDPSCPYVYDNKTMPDYPLRMGWTLQELQDLRPGKPLENPVHTQERAASLIQAWLYFGLIHVITRLPVKTTVLPQHIAKWHALVRSQPIEEQERYIESLDSIIELLAYFQTTVIESSTLPAAVLVSMVVLNKTLQYAKEETFPQSTAPRESWWGRVDRPLRSLLLKNRWCAGVLERTWQRCSSLTLYYMSSLGLNSSLRDHSSCTSAGCRALTVDVKAYKTRHVPSHCTCKLNESATDRVSQIIASGLIPLLSFSENLGLHVESFNLPEERGALEYVAISHIWADGLGNPKENSLPKCQLSLLQNRVTSTMMRLKKQHRAVSNPPPVLFWIDTICIPTPDDAIRAKAITKIEEIFRKATTVLVLDLDLQNLDDDATNIHKAIMIQASAWWTRLWTFLEGTLGYSLYFQLKNISVSPSDLVEEKNSVAAEEQIDKPWDATEMMIRDTISGISDLSLQKLRSEDGRPMFRNITWRSTSRALDECLCLCILLGRDVGRIQKSPSNPDMRMKEFIRIQEFFPSELLFMNAEDEYIDEDGFRWAPRTFLNRAAGPYVESFRLRNPHQDYRRAPSQPDKCFADAGGLHVQYPGFTLLLDHGFQTSRSQPERLKLLNESEGSVYDIQTIRRKSGFHLHWTDISHLRDPKIILPRPPSRQAPVFPGTLVSMLDMTGDVRMEEEQEEAEEAEEGVRDEIACRYQCSVLIAWRGNIPETDQELFKTNLARASSLAPTQRWCVG